MKGRTPVALLTGFLGSGKTTLLARLLGQADFTDTAVVINEFGEVGIDHLVVADVAENIVELRNGCLCCTIRGDLALTLRDLNRRRYLEEIPHFRRVIVETSGLADPVPLAHTLMANPPVQQAYTLDVVICVVDAEHGAATLAAHTTAAAQLALADIVVLSKLDCAAPAAAAAARAAIAAANPTAELVEVVLGDVDAARLLDRALFQPAQHAQSLAHWLGDAHLHHDHGAHFHAHVLRHDASLSLAGTSVFLNRVVNEFRDDILRIKGVAGFREKGGQPALLHAVQNKFYPVQWLERWPDDDHLSRLVLIGHSLDKARIDEWFARLCV